MGKVTVNAPKTPVTKGSMGIAAATVPNVCKMPGPPAPFVPTPLPNIGKSGDSPQDYSTSVTIEGQPVAIRGSSFGSMGDVASQGTGGGLISNCTQGRTKFLGPGSMNVFIEGKNVQLLGDPMLNNCGPGGSPANAATMLGLLQAPGPMFLDGAKVLEDIAKKCNDEVNKKEDKQVKAKKKKRTCQQLGKDKHSCCEGKIQEHRDKNRPNGDPAIEGEMAYQRPKFDKQTKMPIQPVNTTAVGVNRQEVISNACKSCAPGATRDQVGKAIGKALSGLVFPDAAVIGPGGEKTLVDFKFACPESHRSKKKSARKAYRPPRQGTKQLRAHNALGMAARGEKSLTIQF